MRAVLTLLATLATLSCARAASVAPNKPLFNGSIFGKRTNAEWEGAAGAATALCELAAASCRQWQWQAQSQSQWQAQPRYQYQYQPSDNIFQ